MNGERSSKYAWIKAKRFNAALNVHALNKLQQTDESNVGVIYQYAGVWSTFKLFMVLADHKVASLKLATLGI